MRCSSLTAMKKLHKTLSGQGLIHELELHFSPSSHSRSLPKLYHSSAQIYPSFLLIFDTQLDLEPVSVLQASLAVTGLGLTPVTIISLACLIHELRDMAQTV